MVKQNQSSIKESQSSTIQNQSLIQNRSSIKYYRALINVGQPYLYLLPGLIFVFVLVGYGMLSVFTGSIQSASFDGAWTLEYYQALFHNEVFWVSLWFSVRITLVATVLSLLLGIGITRFLYQYFLNDLSKISLWIPMLVPHFVAGYMIVMLFSQGGFVSSIAYQVGWITAPAEFPVLVMDRAGIGIIMTYVWKQVPFVVLMLLPVYYQLDRRYTEVVRTLGGSQWHVFFTVEWKWLFPVVVEVGIILFAFIIAAFEIPFLLGVTYPKMISVLTYQWFYEGSWANRPVALAAMSIITVLILFLSFVSLALLQKTRHRMTKG